MGRKKKAAGERYERHARIAEFYGIDPLAPWWTPEAITGFEANIPKLRSKRIREHMQLHPDVTLNAEGWYDLHLAETGDPAEANRLVNAMLKEKLLRNEPVE